MDNNLVEVNCENFIAKDYFGLISDGKRGQCGAWGCAFVERDFCNSDECEIKSPIKK